MNKNVFRRMGDWNKSKTPFRSDNFQKTFEKINLGI